MASVTKNGSVCAGKWTRISPCPEALGLFRSCNVGPLARLAKRLAVDFVRRPVRALTPAVAVRSALAPGAHEQLGSGGWWLLALGARLYPAARCSWQQGHSKERRLDNVVIYGRSSS
jgi:hypothetical protein